MHHVVLGELQSDPRLKNTLVGSVEVEGSTVRLSVQFDGQEKERALDFAVSIVNQIDHFVSLASSFAAAKLLDSYNENWRHYSASDGIGGFVDVTDPALDLDEFEKRLTLSSVTIYGHTVCEIWFSDGGMFAGHSISVSSFDGTQFGDLDASLYG